MESKSISNYISLQRVSLLKVETTLLNTLLRFSSMVLPIKYQDLN